MFGQKLPIRTTRHTFLESRQPEATKKPYYILSSEWSQKRGISSWATKLHKSRDIWEYFSRFRYIQDSDITGSDNVNQHLRVSQILLLNHCSNLFRTFVHFCFKSEHSTFFSTHACHIHKHATHATHTGTPLARITRHFSNSRNYSRT